MKRRQFIATAATATLAAVAAPRITAAISESAQAKPQAFLENPAVNEFVLYMQNTHGFLSGDLTGFFNRIAYNEKAMALVGTPKKPAKKVYWRDYRKVRLTPKNIFLGKEFMQTHAAALAKTEAQFGVPPAIVTAIIGIETRYGQYLGNYPIAEVISTFAFYHPTRNEEYLAELIALLVYVRDRKIDPLSIKGSFAGAFGIPQFLPSSVRDYAIDLDGNTHIDLFATDDAVGSVGRFLNEKGGWQSGLGISYAVEAEAATLARLQDKTTEHKFQPCFDYAELAELGGSTDAPKDSGENLFLLVDLENRYGTEYRLGTANFYALTRYNKSFKYAAAVVDLAEAILA